MVTDSFDTITAEIKADLRAIKSDLRVMKWLSVFILAEVIIVILQNFFL